MFLNSGFSKSTGVPTSLTDVFALLRAGSQELVEAKVFSVAGAIEKQSCAGSALILSASWVERKISRRDFPNDHSS